MREISTLADLARLNMDEVVDGYLFGFDHQSKPVPPSASYSFMHGYHNALCDQGKMKLTPSMRELTRHVVGTYKGLH